MSQSNGVDPNGRYMQGVDPNGRYMQGVDPNGTANTGKLNGTLSFGVGSDGRAIRVRSIVIDGIQFTSDGPEGLTIEALVIQGVRITAKNGRPMRIEALEVETLEAAVPAPSADKFDPGEMTVTAIELPNGETFGTSEKG